MSNEMERNKNFAQEVMAEPGGEKIVRCFSCGTCTAACPISWVGEEYNPRRIIKMVGMEMREEVLSSPAIWLCSACDLCYRRCPQGIRVSDLMKAIRNIAIREGYEPPGPIALVSEELCSECGLCVTACPYEAITLATEQASGERQGVAQIDKFLCMNCGVCAATCPSKVISIEEFSAKEMVTRTAASLQLMKERKPRIVVFLCQWCLRAKDDLAGLSQNPNIRVISVPCSGSIAPTFILSALTHGADGVLIAGCDSEECHYKEGNFFATKRVMALKPLLETIGIGGDRLRLERIGVADRGKFARTVKEFTQVVKQLGPNPFDNKGGRR